MVFASWSKDAGMDDQRPFNEAVATALHRRLLSKGEFVPYTVERMFDGPVCLCDDFLNGREEYVPAAYIRDALGGQRGNSTYDRYCRYLGRHGADEAAVRKSMSQMIVAMPSWPTATATGETSASSAMSTH